MRSNLISKAKYSYRCAKCNRIKPKEEFFSLAYGHKICFSCKSKDWEKKLVMKKRPEKKSKAVTMKVDEGFYKLCKELIKAKKGVSLIEATKHIAHLFYLHEHLKAGLKNNILEGLP